MFIDKETVVGLPFRVSRSLRFPELTSSGFHFRKELLLRVCLALDAATLWFGLTHRLKKRPRDTEL